MKRSHLLAAVMVGLLGFMTSAATAADQPLDDRFYINSMVSYGVFNEDNFVPGEKVGTRLAFGKTLTKYLALELYAFHFNDIETDGNGGPAAVGNIDSTGYGLSALLFPARDFFPLYAIVGIGAGEYDFDLMGVAENGQDASFVDLGIGFMVPLTQSGIALRSEYRYRTADVDAVGGGEYNFRNQIVSLGIQIPLGAKPQPVVVPTDTTPAEAAPEVEPEIADSDGDGVPDTRDRCPGTPVNTEVNRYGCPTEKAEPIVLKGVTFAYDSAALTASAEDRLDNVVKTLESAEKIDVEVAGHTDSIASAAYNLKLSKERAESVKEYLVKHGIDANRLETIGYGETRPVAPNTEPDGSDNPEGRAKNRRVELHVIEEANGS